jgi:hypothetical protein
VAVTNAAFVSPFFVPAWITEGLFQNKDYAAKARASRETSVFFPHLGLYKKMGSLPHFLMGNSWIKFEIIQGFGQTKKSETVIDILDCLCLEFIMDR